MYKGTNPTCHDFNAETVTAESVALLVGFSEGQVQLIDPVKKELSKLYNEDVSLSAFVLRVSEKGVLYLPFKILTFYSSFRRG